MRFLKKINMIKSQKIALQISLALGCAVSLCQVSYAAGTLYLHTNGNTTQIDNNSDNGTWTSTTEYTVSVGEPTWRAYSETSGDISNKTLNLGTAEQQLTSKLNSVNSNNKYWLTTALSTNGNVSYNTMNIYSNPDDDDVMRFLGAQSMTGNVVSNQIHVYAMNNATGAGRVYGGYHSDSNSVGEVYDNSVNIHAAKAVGVIDGGFSHNGAVYKNNVIISGNYKGNLVDVSGGYSDNGSAYENVVTIGEADNFYVGTVTGYDLTYAKLGVAGGFSQKNSDAEHGVSGNKVNIYGGTFNNDAYIYGGYSGINGGTNAGDANGNIVNIDSASCASNIYGGYSKSGNASNNNITITDSLITGEVYGGWSEAGTTTGNSITLSGHIDASSAKIYGGNIAHNENILNMIGNDIKVGTVGNFKIANIGANGIDTKVTVGELLKAETIRINGKVCVEGAIQGDVECDNSLFKYYIDNENKLQSEIVKADDAYGNKVIIGKVLDAANNDENVSQNLTNFINRATSNTFYTNDEQISLINALSAMNELGGVSHLGQEILNGFTEIVASNAFSKGDLSKDSTGDKQERVVWTQFVHGQENIDDLSIADMKVKYDTKINGIVVGSDLYNDRQKKIGVALSYIDGNVSGTNAGVRSENEAKYYGMSLYGAAKQKNIDYLIDVTYLHGNNDLKQNYAFTNVGGRAKSDVFSVGAKAELSIDYPDAKLIPYVGVRYAHMGIGEYINSLGLHYDADEQNIANIPFGIKYTTDIKQGEWTIRPSIDLGYQINFGDVDSREKVSYGLADDSFSYSSGDKGAFTGKVCLAILGKYAIYSLDYQYAKSSHTNANKFGINAQFCF